MSRPTEHRTFDTRWEIRSTGDGLTIEGIAAPFDSPATIHDPMGDFVESIAPGAFAKTIRERGDRVPIYAQHDVAQLPVGKAVSLSERTDGLHVVARLSDTQAGRDLATLARDGVVRGLSIGFQAVRDSWDRQSSSRRLLEVALREISLTPNPAYADAAVHSVRTERDPSNLHPHLAVARLRLSLHDRSI